MLTTVEAEIDVNGNIRLLEPLEVKRKSRVIVTLLEDKSEKKEPTEAEKQAAEERFARWIGSVKSGDSRSADNEKIDADLAKEYGATHDDE